MLVINLVVVLVTLQVVNSDDPCLTPNGQNGDCVTINKCPSLFSLFERRPISTSSTSNQNFLRQSQCGSVGGYPKVCCPIGSSTPPSTKPRNAFFVTSDLLPDSTACGGGGGIQRKIYGGESTDLDEFPWMALLEYETEGGKRKFGCGGALINQRYVLTARHCVTSSLRNVRLGEYNTTTDPDCIKSAFGKDCAEKALNISIEEKISYKDKTSNQGDIALLRLSQEVQYSDFVKPICLPNAVGELTRSYFNKTLVVAGWGITEKELPSEVKLKVQVPVKRLSECVVGLRSVFNAEVNLHEGQLCAGGDKGKDSCNGDSGGPLMSRKIDKDRNPRWYAIGVVSFGPNNPCGQKDKPAVYVKVVNYVEWIVSNLKP